MTEFAKHCLINISVGNRRDFELCHDRHAKNSDFVGREVRVIWRVKRLNSKGGYILYHFEIYCLGEFLRETLLKLAGDSDANSGLV